MQKRAKTTRDTVLLAGARVFERHGFAAATISEILTEAGVTKGAMYFHFESKESLASAIIAEQSNWRQENTKPAECPVQRLIDLSYRFVQALRVDPLVRASIRLTLERSTFDIDEAEDPYGNWIEAVNEILNEAEDELVVTPSVAANVIVSSITGAQLVSQARSGRVDLAERIHDVWKVLSPGLVDARTLRRLNLTGSKGATLA